MNEFKYIFQEKINYKNFAEEVGILSEAPAGTNVSLYTIINKNGATFQNVPGMPFQRGRARFGYVNGDRTRPVIIGSSDISAAMRAASAQFSANDIAPGATRTISTTPGESWPEADINTITKWDIQLTVSISPSCTDTTTQTEAVEAW